MGGRVLVGAAARAVTRSKRSATHRLTALELVLQPLALARSHVLSGRQTQRFLELPLQVIRAHPGLFAQALEGDSFLAQVREVTVDEIACALNGGVWRLGAVRSAPLAGAEAGPLGGFDRGEKRDVVALGLPRRARRPAIDARRRLPVEKTLVSGSVAMEYLLPGSCFSHGNRLHFPRRSCPGLHSYSLVRYENHNSRRRLGLRDVPALDPHRLALRFADDEGCPARSGHDIRILRSNSLY